MALGLGLSLALGGLGIGTFMSARSQYQQGQMAGQMYQYNRSLSLRYAKTIREIRAYEEMGYWKKAAKVYPRQKVVTAAAGLEISGTPLKVMRETRQKLEEQAKIMSYEKEMEIASIKAGAAISGFRGQLAERAGRYGMWSTLLTGAGTLGLYRHQYGK